MSKLYYTAPSDQAFKEMKQAATRVWLGYDDEFGYATEKVDRIKDIENIRDNFMYMLAMFDQDNQRKVIADISDVTKIAVKERMVSGGALESEMIRMGL